MKELGCLFLTLFLGPGRGRLGLGCGHPQLGCPIPNQEKSRGGTCGEEVFSPCFQRWSGESDREKKQET